MLGLVLVNLSESFFRIFCWTAIDEHPNCGNPNLSACGQAYIPFMTSPLAGGPPQSWIKKVLQNTVLPRVTRVVARVMLVMKSLLIHVMKPHPTWSKRHVGCLHLNCKNMCVRLLAQIKLQRYTSLPLTCLCRCHCCVTQFPGSRWIALRKFWAGGARRSSGTSPGVAQRRMPGSCDTVLSWQKVPLRCPDSGFGAGQPNPSKSFFGQVLYLKNSEWSGDSVNPSNGIQQL